MAHLVTLRGLVAGAHDEAAPEVDGVVGGAGDHEGGEVHTGRRHSIPSHRPYSVESTVLRNHITRATTVNGEIYGADNLAGNSAATICFQFSKKSF